MADVILSGKQPAFVAMYVDNELAGGQLTVHEVAVKAGYAPKSAGVTASNLLASPNIQTAIADRKRFLAEQAAGLVDVDAKRVLREWAVIATADPTRIVNVRRLNCRHCWGVGFLYQFTDNEFARGTAEAIQQGEDLSAYDGGGGFHKLKAPNPDCPECAGEGVEDVTIADFRRLPDNVRRLIAGVKMGKHGIEVSFRDQDAALKNLAQYLGLLVNKNEHTGKDGGPIQTASVNYDLPSDPVEAARQYQMLMEGKR